MNWISVALSTVFFLETASILLVQTIIIQSNIMCDNDPSVIAPYVDPSDMGSYSHSLQRNIGEIKCSGPKEDAADQASDQHHTGVQNQGPTGMKSDVPCACDCDCEICHNPGELVYMQRVVGSILRQLNVKNHNFGPKESITIDLQAELSFEDLSKLYKFLMNKSMKKGQGSDPLYEIRWTTEVAAITDIVGNLFHIVYPQPAVTIVEFLKENINFQYVSSVQFWVYLSIGALVVFLVILLLRWAYMSSHPIRAMFYSFGIFFVISCVIVYYDLYENARAENMARLNQYEKIPKDCNYNDLGFTDSIAYFFRVHWFHFKDQCTEYHKLIRGDEFFHVTPVEAISETISRFVFHPLEYVGERLGKFFGGLLGDVPWLLKPFLLVIICTFALLAIFRYRIRMPFISIEPSPQRPAIYSDPSLSSLPAAVPPEAIASSPQPTCTFSNASTSTEDFDEYLNNILLRNEPDFDQDVS